MDPNDMEVHIETREYEAGKFENLPADLSPPSPGGPVEGHDDLQAEYPMAQLSRRLEEKVIKFQSPQVTRTSVGTINISHNIPSLNRVIEAVYGTDIFRVAGKYELCNTVNTTHTRLFEAIGDWVPNLMIISQGQPTFYYPVKWSAIHGSFKPVNEPMPAGSGTCRYRLFNGKFIDIPKTPGNMPVFLVFKNQVDFDGYDVRGIRACVTTEEVAANSSLLKDPLKTPGLFANAVKLARSEMRQQPSLAYYIKPRPEQLGETPAARAYCDVLWQEELRMSELGSETHLNTLRSYIVAATDRIYNGEDFDASIDEPLIEFGSELLAKIDNGGLSEEEAEEMHKQLLEFFAQKDSHMSAPTGIITEDVIAPTMLPQTEVITTEIHFDGKPYAVEVQLDGDYIVPPGYTVIPPNPSVELTYTLAGLPSLGKGLRTMHARYTFNGHIYCDSVTPRKLTEERGIGKGPTMWKEKLSLSASYEGLFIYPSAQAESYHYDYACAYNTALFGAFVRKGMYPYQLHAFRPIPAVLLPQERTGPYFEGLGFSNYGIAQSVLMPPGFRWRDHNLYDARIHLPPDVLVWLVEHPDRIQISNREDFLAGRAPLELIFSDKDGRTIKVFDYTPGIRIDFEIDAHARAITWKMRSSTLDDNEIVTTTLPSRKFEKGGSSGQFLPSKRWADAVETDASVGLDYSPTGSSVPTPDATITVLPYTIGQHVPLRKATTWPSWNEEPLMVGRSRKPYLPGDWQEFCNYCTVNDGLRRSFENLYSAHWQHANGRMVYDVVRYHHPRWIRTLENKPFNPSWFHDIVHNLNPCPDMMINERGYQRLQPSQVEAYNNRVHEQPVRSIRTRGSGANWDRGRRGGRGRGQLAYLDPLGSYYLG